MRRKRAVLIAFLLLAGLIAACGLWVRSQNRQYWLNRQLIDALEKGDNQQALALVNAGADPNTHSVPTPPLSLPERVKLLFHLSRPLENGSPTALSIACGASWDPTYASGIQGDRPDAPQLVAAMLRHGANVNVEDEAEGGAFCTPLHLAAHFRRQGTVGVLLHYGANVNAWDQDGNTPLLEAACRESVMRYIEIPASPGIVRLLLEHGANPNLQDYDGRTALYRDMYDEVEHDGDNEVRRQLLAHGADPNLADWDRKTPLMLAQENHRPDMVALLKQYGARK